ncbi:MAG TPA: TorF family putative porin [Phenylobacterium sp.]|uniref:TorF family putative porin n=1 Tax=Phenylobacterium sp. TaxID=1871053 RepID=UPI002B478791|nr:TorF family putative porin [Phenylobacterium sp.]HKR90122.1 TorF family putative porin [Phenylobacterium sp.]
MKSLKLSLLAAVGALAFAGAAHADDAGRPLGLVFNAGGATDYIFRGVSQTQNQPQVFAGADVTIGKIGYAGTWWSNIDFGDSADTEYDLYFGVKPTLGPVTFDFGAIRYGYLKDHNDWSYWEVKAAGSVPVGPATIGAAFYYSPNTTGPGNINSYYYELNGSVPIPNSKFSVSGAVGYQQYEGPGDYTTWNLGVGYAVTDKIGLDFRYWDTNEHDFGKIYKARFVAGIKATF